MDTDNYFIKVRNNQCKIIKEHTEEFGMSDYDKDYDNMLKI